MKFWKRRELPHAEELVKANSRWIALRAAWTNFKSQRALTRERRRLTRDIVAAARLGWPGIRTHREVSRETILWLQARGYQVTRCSYSIDISW